MEFLPIFLDLRRKPVLVVGGGEVASRKVSLLLQAQAAITVVAPALSPGLQELADGGAIVHLARGYQAGDLAGCHLAIAATDSAEVNRTVSEHAQALRLPLNVVDQPELCSFIVPSIIDRSPVVAAVSTGGASPVLARLIRARLESLIPAAYGRLAELSERFRERVKAKIGDNDQRRRFWERVLSGGVAERVFAGRIEEADAAMERELAETANGPPKGEVYLVGGGPGDPDLLSFRALRLMQQADVVVYDRLVAKAVLDLTRKDAERIYVGKERNQHTMRQEEINQLLARLAKEGKKVVRLKGGDPFIFGRGGEEIHTLAEEGVPFQVVPAVTAASGCAAYSGIPLTHRDYAQSVTFVTGHLKDGSMNLNWGQLSQPHQTVVFYMGLLGLPVICRELMAHGTPPEMPIAIIQQGTTEKQRVFTGTLATIEAILAEEKPEPPTLIIVGEVVKLRERLAWYDAPERPRRGATSPAGIGPDGLTVDGG
jgi:uroporphyrin-III C-methyltransferase / precorrin-2 dehydrogenase / sirohydrochlorin ferrochelatase